MIALLIILPCHPNVPPKKHPLTQGLILPSWPPGQASGPSSVPGTVSWRILDSFFLFWFSWVSLPCLTLQTGRPKGSEDKFHIILKWGWGEESTLFLPYSQQFHDQLPVLVILILVFLLDFFQLVLRAKTEGSEIEKSHCKLPFLTWHVTLPPQ